MRGEVIELGIAHAPVERRNYTEFRVSAAVAEAAGAAVRGAAFGAVEIAAGAYARAFAAAEVEPAGARTSALTPALLSNLARRLVTGGEWLGAIEVDPAGAVELREAVSWDVRGGPAPGGWRYTVTTSGPSSSLTETVPAAGVVHVRYATRPGEPWRGRSPLSFAEDSRALAGALELRLGQELAGPVGQIIALPQDAGGEGEGGEGEGGEGGEGEGGEGGEGEGADPLAPLRRELGALGGRLALVETVSAGWGEGRAAAPSSDWTVRRLGADPPAALGLLRAAVEATVLGLLGIPPGLADASADGTAQRESYRRWLHGSVQPLARLVEHELHAKLDTDARLSFRRLEAGDIAGRARAWRSLAGKEASIADAEARRLAGLE